MRYISTRGEAPVLGFDDALLTGLARDGGLYVPESWPVIEPWRMDALRGATYNDTAYAVMKPFVGDCIDEPTLRAIIRKAYDGFGHPATAPLVQIDETHWVLELFHGPTLAFKDLAMQLIGHLFDHVLESRGARSTIIGATSGDTGSAAIEAFKGRDFTDVFILYPHGRVSEVQRRQMTTAADANVHAFAVEGNFDDCQALVKAMFNDFAFRDAMRLGAVNSINWARVLAQVVYYATSSLTLAGGQRLVNYAVPTGNFGDIFAGYVAKRMGFPIGRLMIATNENDILHRCAQTGAYRSDGVVQTTSPSMDIQVSSNFERLIFDLCDRDGAAVRAMMQELKTDGGFDLSQGQRARLRDEFDSARADRMETAATIDLIRRETGMVLDPHTAVGHFAARNWDVGGPIVSLACAHPAKFPDAVREATGVDAPLPDRLSDLYEREERFTVVANDLAAVEAAIKERSRIHVST